MDVDSEIRAVLAQHAKLSRPPAEIERASDLFAAGLDSQSVVNVMLVLEERFAFGFPDNNLNRDSNVTIAALAGPIIASGAKW